MSFSHYFTLIRLRASTVAIITLIVFLLVAAVTFVQPQRYRATTNLLVVQRYSWNLDAYSASRSTQYLTTVLAKVVHSQDFFDQVMASNHPIENVFPQDPKDRAKAWKKTVRTSLLDQTGIVTIDVYHTNREQARLISSAISDILMTKGHEYHGGGNQVVIRMLDAPIVSKRTVQPNIPINLLAGLLLGLVLGAGYVSLFPIHNVLSNRKREEESSFSDEPMFASYEESGNRA